MGMCLDATPEMGELQTEVRSRSAKIYSDPLIFSAEDGVFEFDLVDLPKVRAALDQIEQYTKERK